jgi:hypothetical protein
MVGMCGVAGFQGLGHLSSNKRKALALSLATGIDRRGGDACGYFAVDNAGEVKVGRAYGKWSDSVIMLLNSVDKGAHSLALHARYATCGTKHVKDAHPFTIKRSGKVEIIGMHNGVIHDADDSAKAHGRDYTVDSKELFELLADGERESIAALQGYGTIVWVKPEEPTIIRMARLTESADLAVASLAGGGLVWGSTKTIVDTALMSIGVYHGETFWETEAGFVHFVENGKLFVDRKDRISLSSWKSKSRTSFSSYGWHDEAAFDEYVARRYGRGSPSIAETLQTIGDPPGFTSEEEEVMAALQAEEDELKRLRKELVDDYGLDPAAVEAMGAEEVYMKMSSKVAGWT